VVFQAVMDVRDRLDGVPSAEERSHWSILDAVNELLEAVEAVAALRDAADAAVAQMVAAVTARHEGADDDAPDSDAQHAGSNSREVRGEPLGEALLVAEGVQRRQVQLQMRRQAMGAKYAAPHPSKTTRDGAKSTFNHGAQRRGLMWEGGGRSTDATASLPSVEAGAGVLRTAMRLSLGLASAGQQQQQQQQQQPPPLAAGPSSPMQNGADPDADADADADVDRARLCVLVWVRACGEEALGRAISARGDRDRRPIRTVLAALLDELRSTAGRLTLQQCFGGHEAPVNTRDDAAPHVDDAGVAAAAAPGATSEGVAGLLQAAEPQLGLELLLILRSSALASASNERVCALSHQQDCEDWAEEHLWQTVLNQVFSGNGQYTPAILSLSAIGGGNNQQRQLKKKDGGVYVLMLTRLLRWAWAMRCYHEWPTSSSLSSQADSVCATQSKSAAAPPAADEPSCGAERRRHSSVRWHQRVRELCSGALRNTHGRGERVGRQLLAACTASYDIVDCVPAAVRSPMH
jgi:hypothetical protein